MGSRRGTKNKYHGRLAQRRAAGIIAGMSDTARTAIEALGLLLVAGAFVLAIVLLTPLLWTLAICGFGIGVALIALAHLAKPVAEEPE